MSAADRAADLVAGLAQIVSESQVLDTAALVGRDPGFHPDNFAAGLAVRPGTTEEVAEIVRFCAEHGIGIVPQGGRTGLSGGAESAPGQVILMCDRMNRIVEIDPAGMLAVVEAGVTLAALAEATAGQGLSPGIDLGARGSATIGGLIATNAGGTEAFRLGTMRNRLLGLEAVLPDGTVLDEMTRVTKCNEGYDLKQLLCGAEGTLGIVTRAVLRLVTAEGATVTLLCACPDAAAALRVFRHLQREAGLLRGEIMWRAHAETVARAIGLGHVLAFAEAPVYAIFEVAEGSGDLEALLAQPVAAGDIRDALIAANQRQQGEIWRIREESFAVEHEVPHGAWYDVSVPLTGLDAYEAGLKRRLAALDPQLRLFLFGHLGDGNLHATVGTGERMTPEAVGAISAAVYDGLKAAGGSFSAEHGIGTEKRKALDAHAAPAKLAAMRAIKRALDPKGIMNPGKVIQGQGP